MSMISYAQNAEDVLLQRCFQNEPPQFYVDVGAAHPTFHSVTKHFSNLGWRGLNLEPRPTFCRLLQHDRPKDITLNCAVSDTKRSATFYEVVATGVQSADNGGLSTLDPAMIDHYRQQGFQITETQIEVRTLQEVLEAQGVEQIGFLKIDVEGHEAAVVSGMDWKRWRPRVVVIEGTRPLSSSKADSGPIDHISAQGYQHAFFDGLNHFLVRKEDSKLRDQLSTPANVFDQFIPFEHLNERCQLQHELEQYRAGSSTKQQQLEKLFEEVRNRDALIEELQSKLARAQRPLLWPRAA